MNELSIIDPKFLYSELEFNRKVTKLNSTEKDFKKILKDKKETELKKFKEVCYQFESIFVNMMLREMRKTLNKYRLIPQNPAEEIFNDMLYQEYALKIAKSEQLGLAKIIYEQYSKYI
jgi:flagellar protein FlgJ